MRNKMDRFNNIYIHQSIASIIIISSLEYGFFNENKRIKDEIDKKGCKKHL